jgi:anaerobic selenocysteine-containing dehydrogenase
MFWITEPLRKMAPGPVVALNPADAQRLALEAGAAVTVSSPEGSLPLTVAIDESVNPGTAWIPESLPGAPVGALLNGSANQRVRVELR